LLERGLALLQICFLLGQGSALEFERAPHRLGRLKLRLFGLALGHGPELLGRLQHGQRRAIHGRLRFRRCHTDQALR